MRRLIDHILSLSTDEGYLHFQHDLTRRMYDALGQGYVGNENEVSLIKRVVNAVNNRSYHGVRVFANVIHGSRSYVEFNFMDKPVTKELGDMTIVTLVTDGKDRLVQKTCIIQNKKKQNDRWNIDEEQLYLLKNFPPFSGSKGIFKKCKELAFRNTSGCLGCYGLFYSPGEMIFTSAPALTEMLRGKKSVTHADIGLIQDESRTGFSGKGQSLPWWPGFLWRHPKEIYMMFEEMVSIYGYPMVAGIPFNGFMGCTSFARDINDFAWNWTQLNIGEPTTFSGRIINPAVDAFGNFVIRSAGFKDLGVDLPTGDYFGDQEFEGHMAIMLLHLDISANE